MQSSLISLEEQVSIARTSQPETNPTVYPHQDLADGSESESLEAEILLLILEIRVLTYA